MPFESDFESFDSKTGGTELTLALSIIGVIAAIAIFLALWIKAARERRELEQSSITPEALFALVSGALVGEKREVLIFDVRQPLDLLADSEIIPGARRVPPKDVEDNPTLIPRDQDTVVYCTCPSDKTSMTIAQRAHALNFFRVRFLKGGLAAWKEKGYPVEPYRETFHLDTAQ
jgi:rhodanese-related sulfurtransferase